MSIVEIKRFSHINNVMIAEIQTSRCNRASCCVRCWKLAPVPSSPNPCWRWVGCLLDNRMPVLSGL